MKTIILSAGQGSRLLPLTQKLPKCLLPVADGITLLDWQISQLDKAGIKEVIVVTGFKHSLIQEALEHYSGNIKISTLFNPFYNVADNLASVWLACKEIVGDCLLINGDSLFTSNIIKQVSAALGAPIIVTISKKETYDADDMKVVISEQKLCAIGKKIPLVNIDAEAIGVIKFNAQGSDLFRNTVEEAMLYEVSLKRYYLHVINNLAQCNNIGTALVAQDQWCEVDFPHDLEKARHCVSSWQQA